MSLQRRDWLEAGVLVNTPQAAANGFPFGTVEFCRANGISLQAWGALAQGRFTGRQETPGEVATAQLISALADKKGTTPETILLWWLQRHPAAIVPVVGSARPERIRACRDAAQRNRTSAGRNGTNSGSPPAARLFPDGATLLTLRRSSCPAPGPQDGGPARGGSAR